MDLELFGKMQIWDNFTPSWKENERRIPPCRAPLNLTTLQFVSQQNVTNLFQHQPKRWFFHIVLFFLLKSLDVCITNLISRILKVFTELTLGLTSKISIDPMWKRSFLYSACWRKLDKWLKPVWRRQIFIDVYNSVSEGHFGKKRKQLK